MVPSRGPRRRRRRGTTPAYAARRRRQLRAPAGRRLAARPRRHSRLTPGRGRNGPAGGPVGEWSGRYLPWAASTGRAAGRAEEPDDRDGSVRRTPLRADRAERRSPSCPWCRASCASTRATPGSRPRSWAASTCSWRRRPPTSSTARSPATSSGSFDVICERMPAGIQITVHDEGLPYDPSLTPGVRPRRRPREPDRRRPRQLPHAADRRRGRVPQPRQPRQGDGDRQVPAGRHRHRRAAGRGGAARGARARAGRRARRRSRSARCARSRRSRCAAASTTRTATPTSTSTCTTRTASSRSTRAATWSRRWPARPTARSPGTRRSSSPRTRTRSPTSPSWPPRPSSAGSRSPGASGEYLDAEALARGLHGLFIEEVTVHTFTQKFCHRLGFVDTGFLLAYSPATMAFKGIAEETGARRSVILGFKYLVRPQVTRVYAPRRHRETIAAHLRAARRQGRVRGAVARGAPGRAAALREREPQARGGDGAHPHLRPRPAAAHPQRGAAAAARQRRRRQRVPRPQHAGHRPGGHRPRGGRASCSPASCPAAARATG